MFRLTEIPAPKLDNQCKRDVSFWPTGDRPVRGRIDEIAATHAGVDCGPKSVVSGKRLEHPLNSKTVADVRRANRFEWPRRFSRR